MHNAMPRHPEKSQPPSLPVTGRTNPNILLSFALFGLFCMGLLWALSGTDNLLKDGSIEHWQDTTPLYWQGDGISQASGYLGEYAAIIDAEGTLSQSLALAPGLYRLQFIYRGAPVQVTWQTTDTSGQNTETTPTIIGTAPRHSSWHDHAVLLESTKDTSTLSFINPDKDTPVTIDGIYLQAVKADANLVTNGEFKTNEEWIWGDSMNPTKLAGWDISPRIQLHRSGKEGIAAVKGEAFLELEVAPNSPVETTISQHIDTTVGDAYWLTLWYRGRRSQPPTTNDIRLLWEDEEVAILSQQTPLSWQKHHYLLSAAQTLSTLSFEIAGIHDGYGGLLDDIRLYALGDELLENGSFEDIPELPWGDSGTFSKITGWQGQDWLEIHTSGVDGIPAKDGDYFLELDVTNNEATTQTIKTIPGHTYLLSLYYRPRTTDPKSNSLDIQWGRHTLATLTPETTDWQQYHWPLTAEDTVTTLTLQATGKSDGKGGLIDQISLRLIKDRLPTTDTGSPANTPPQITSSPITKTTVDNLYQYQLTAADPDEDPLSYTLTVAPAGMTIDHTGLISWMPTQEGHYPVHIEVKDDKGGKANQSFTLTVTPANQPPQITSTPETTATIDTRYQYQITAKDPDQDPLTYTLTVAPAGMTIDHTGLIDWTPTQTGDYPVHITVSDDKGATDNQAFMLQVNAQGTEEDEDPGEDEAPRQKMRQHRLYHRPNKPTSSKPSLSCTPAKMPASKSQIAQSLQEKDSQSYAAPSPTAMVRLYRKSPSPRWNTPNTGAPKATQPAATIWR